MIGWRWRACSTARWKGENGAAKPVSASAAAPGGAAAGWACHNKQAEGRGMRERATERASEPGVRSFSFFRYP